MYYFLSIKDILITPLYFLLICIAIFFIGRKTVKQEYQQYFFWGILVKIISAILVGVIYEFIYEGGDTSAYWRHGNVVGEAFFDSPTKWLKLLSHHEVDADIRPYTTRMLWWYKDKSAFFPSRVAGIVSPLCFGTYTIVAMFFAILSFNGIWHLYLVFTDLYPKLYKKFAISILFIPSVFFWGSGILKDSLVIAGLGWFVYAFYFGLIKRERLMKCAWLLCLGFLFLSNVKPYVLISFFPPMVLWLYFLIVERIKTVTLKFFFSFFTFLLVIVVLNGFLGFIQEEFKAASNLNDIAKQMQVTSTYITYVSEKSDGSTYSIGVLDGTVSGTLALAPNAIFVSLFRPFIWESRNPIMLLSAVESTWLLFLTINILVRTGFSNFFKVIAADRTVIFCLFFSLIFAFVVGISSSNFGALVRYKIPLLPFYVSALFIINNSRVSAIDKPLEGKISKRHLA